MTPVKPTKPVEIRAPRKAYFKIREGWLQITPPNEDDRIRINLGALNFYRLKKYDLILSGKGYTESLRAEQISDAERDDERRDMVVRLAKMLDLYFSLNVTVEPTVATPAPVEKAPEPAAESAE
jgi:hypothetical protein